MRSPASPHPVAVIGGGLAGCAACLGLVRRGVNVVWIAPGGTIVDKPGESLAPAGLAVLTDMGLDDLLTDPVHRKSMVSFTAWGSDALLERHAAGQLGGMGHILNRSHFEMALFQKVRKADGLRWHDASLAAFSRSATGWTLATDGGEVIEASLVIDATGRRAMIGRTQTTLRRLDRLVSAYAFLEQADLDVDPTPATVIEAVGDGWWYATLLPNRTLALNFYTDPDLMPRRIGSRLDDWRQMVAKTHYIARWIESAGYAIRQPPRLASAGTVWLETAAGPEWLAIGDAAVSFDPLSAHGMTTALWTGNEAAAAVARAWDGDDAALDGYASRLRLGVAQYDRERRAIYAREVRFSDYPFWMRRNDFTQHEPL
jgi:2-polyprenyl-6-methoxyphenol hydroxylase-like FAD-dependent oxidoreductase